MKLKLITIAALAIFSAASVQAGETSSANKKNLAAATLPAGAVVSGGLTWTRNNTTVPGGESSWYTADNTCKELTAQGLRAGTWRLPTKAELLALYEAGNNVLSAAGWTLSYTWSSTTNEVGDHYYVGLFRDRVGPDNGSIRCYVSCVH